MRRINVMVFLMLIFVFHCNAAIKSRDPTAPLDLMHSDAVTDGLDESDKKALNIQGLFVSKSKRVALIDDVFFAVGDVTRQGPVVAIFKDRIVIKQGKTMRVVFMSNDKVRQDK